MKIQNQTMNNKLYKKIKEFLKDDTLPTIYPSNKSNFLATTKKYELNKKGYLMRNKKAVVKNSMRDKIWSSLHNHSGRSACWERINAR